MNDLHGSPDRLVPESEEPEDGGRILILSEWDGEGVPLPDVVDTHVPLHTHIILGDLDAYPVVAPTKDLVDQGRSSG